MASVNKVILIGAVGQDPKIKEYSEGKKVAALSLATSMRVKDKNGEWGEQTEWHKLVVWGKTAEVVEKYVRQGSSIYVEGRLATRKYTNKEGVEVATTEVVVDTLQLLGGKPKEEKSAVEEEDNDKFPF